MIGGVLAAIARDRLCVVEQRRRVLPERELRQLAEARAERALGFVASLKAAGAPALVAEIKRRSPSAGPLRPNLDVGRVCLQYVLAGAAAISILTEPNYFGGDYADLRVAKRALGPVGGAPLLLKDFVLTTYQLYEARLVGADAVLLIAACLSDAQLSELYSLTLELGMCPLVEVHSEEELSRAVELSPAIVGINNRDLVTMQTSLSTTFQLAPLVPPGTLILSESGIRTRQDVEAVLSAGAHAVLVGESILREGDVATKIRQLLGKERGD